MLTDKGARDAAYRASYCVDCGAEPYSAGRPRCDNCHAEHLKLVAAGGK